MRVSFLLEGRHQHASGLRHGEGFIVAVKSVKSYMISIIPVGGGEEASHLDGFVLAKPDRKRCQTSNESFIVPGNLLC